MAVVDCSINIFRCNEEAAAKSWPLLLRLEKDRFSTLEGVRSHFKDRLKETTNELGVQNFVCKFFLVLKDSNKKEKYEIEGDLDWKEYLPFLLEDTRYALRINVIATGSASGKKLQINGVSSPVKPSEKFAGQPLKLVQVNAAPSPKGFKPATIKPSSEPAQNHVTEASQKKVTFPSTKKAPFHEQNAPPVSPKPKTFNYMASPFKITATSAKPDASSQSTTPWQVETANNPVVLPNTQVQVQTIKVVSSTKKSNTTPQDQQEEPACDKLNILYNFKRTAVPLKTQEEPLTRQTASPRQLRRSLRRKTIGAKPETARKDEARKQVHHGIERLMINIKK